ncbi:probable cytochrome P450 9f2 [Uranotaenia lowii]|uniref:probable cytochrome P450 9f2 n=1 Tax=Uranotaenia lowii TaxID=190385 RepID=UPI00247AC339|nr:probable cytochrome P450 9f2 [Uranotaenia lowii]
MEIGLITLGLILTALVLIYRRITHKNDYFHDKPIPSMAVQPIFGSTAGPILNRTTFSEFIGKIYNKYAGVKVFGLFDMTMPMFVIRDPELIKNLAVKHFDHFVDHRPLFETSNESPDIYFNKMLISLTGQKWRDMRAMLSPAFTGTKMRTMLGLMTGYSEQAVSILKQQASRSGGYLHYEMKDLFIRMANDIIATCAFGLKVESIENSENDFFRMAQRMFNSNKLKMMARILTSRIWPGLLSKFDIDLFDRDITKYFSQIIREAVRTRKEQGIVRPDMINMLMQAQQGTLKHAQDPATEADQDAGFSTVEESNVGKQSISRAISEPEFIAQCLVFFVGGFDSISSILTFASYELAVNPDVQQRLYEEIQETNKNLQGKPLDYDTLQKMKYMDMVISETLRHWCAPALDRICVQDFHFDDGNGLKFTIDKGTSIWIPVHGLHHDPKYFPNPERFDPERFNEENRKNINMDAYIPFGVGPRNCIGSRFALMEMKALLFAVLKEFCLERTAETQVPLKLAKGLISLNSEKGVHLRLSLRQ